ncbi:hypothetical protein P4O66_003383 [Electrophorus voltai]|uniref:Contactin-5 n=1 Tax=Electrophorus voltai TaxID=2609070 RepID=A0AAD8YRH4_9TELE|nr:hypothetical protein P4O66_003383 [Electrophorus voltai]
MWGVEGCWQPSLEQGFSPRTSAKKRKSEEFGPVFVQEPDDVIFALDSDDKKVTLSCEARGSPAPTYSWLINRTHVDVEADIHYSLIGGNLVIHNASEAVDFGRYQCRVENSVGAVLSREALLQFAYLGVFSSRPRGGVSVREGQGVVLMCTPPPHSAEIIYSWVFNEFPSFVAEDSRRFISQETGNLYISKVQPSDVGSYICLVKNTVTSTRVLSPPTPLTLKTDGIMGEYEPKIEVHFPPTVLAAKGVTVRLECFALGNPVPTITWRKINGNIPKKARLRKSQAVLEIPSVQLEDSGSYECKAENSRGGTTFRGHLQVYTLTHQTHLRIYPSTQPPLIHPHAAPLKAHERAPSALEGRVNHAGHRVRPAGCARWLSARSTQPKPVEPCVPALRGSRDTSFPQANVTQLQCLSRQASRGHGLPDEEKLLYVLGDHKVLSTLAALCIRSCHSLREPMPLWISMINDSQLDSGEQLQWECRATGKPRPTYRWLRNGEPLTPQTRVGVLNGELQIRKVQPADSGMYQCVAENKYGSVYSSAELKILASAPVFSANPVTTIATVGKEVSLECRPRASPKPRITWKKGERRIQASRSRGSRTRAVLHGAHLGRSRYEHSLLETQEGAWRFLGAQRCRSRGGAQWCSAGGVQERVREALLPCGLPREPPCLHHLTHHPHCLLAAAGMFMAGKGSGKRSIL